MNELSMTADVQMRSVVVGERLWARVEVLNPGPFPAEVQSLPSPLVYELAAEAEGGRRLALSAARLQALTPSPNPAPPREPRKQRLRAGERARFGADLTKLALESLRPGRYRLGMRLPGDTPDDDLAVAAGEVEVAPLVVSSLVHVLCQREQSSCTLLAAEVTGGGIALLFRESAVGRPQVGSAFRVAPLTAAPTGLAIASGPSEDLARRWLAWTDASGFGAVRCLGTAAEKPIAASAADLGLTDLRLAPLGVQLGGARAAFAVAGLRSGQTHLACLHLDGAAAPRLAGPVAVSGPLPERLVAWSPRFGAEGTVRVAWSSTTPGGGAAVRTAVLGLDGGVREPERTVLERASPLLDLLLAAGGSEVRALFGPETEPPDGEGGEPRRVVVVARVALTGADEPELRLVAIDPPPASALASAEALHPWVRLLAGEIEGAWALGAGADGPAVAVKLQDRVFAATADDPRWQEAAVVDPAATCLHIQTGRQGASPDHVAWVEPAAGLRVVPLA